MRKKEEIAAIHKSDIEVIFETLGILDELKKAGFRCIKCNEVITFDNLFSFWQDSLGFHLTCTKPDCNKD